MSKKLTPFHVAIAVRNIEEAREFYGNILGFKIGRSSDMWIDFDMFGHQFVVHLNKSLGANGTVQNVCNDVDKRQVPVPHCGVVLEFDEWNALVKKVSGFVDFIIEPYIRFKGELGEQGTMFFADPSGNPLEFKAFKNIEEELFKN